MKVCVSCQIELRPKENGIVAVVMADFGPCELYEADVWHCNSCGWEGVLGFAAKPFSSHFEIDFSQELENAKLDRTVVFCWQNERVKSSATVRPAMAAFDALIENLPINEEPRK